MRHLLRPLAIGTFGLVFTIAPAFALQTQDTSKTSSDTKTTQAGATAQPCQTTGTQAATQSTAPTQTTSSAQSTTPAQSTPPTQSTAPVQPSSTTTAAPQPCAQTTSTTPKLQPGDPGYNAPVAQKTDPNVKPGSKQDVEAIGNRNVGKGVDWYSIEHEIAEGKQYAQQVEQTSRLVDDPVVLEYVNRTGQNLVNNSDCKVPFTIKVIDSDEVNAFALPGGFFYVNSGLILRAQEESELAGVMAHEIAHVCARHGTKNQTKGDILQLASIPLFILLPGGYLGYGIYEGLQFAIPISFLKFSRNDEREADYLGLQYMYKAGYDPNAYITFFERILSDEKRSPGSISKFFSDHPPTGERIESSEKEIAQILPARDTYVVTTSEFDTVKARLAAYERRKKPLGGKNDSPTLRTKTEQQKTGNADPTQTTNTNGGDDSDRPVLKKRPDGSGNN
jgi:beta-barrel assembly-enhancing protease